MEAIGVRTVVAHSLTTCGLGASRGKRRSGNTPSSLQFCQAPKELRKLIEAADGVSASVKGGEFVQSLKNVAFRERKQLLFASLVSGIASVQPALAVTYDDMMGTVKEAAVLATESLSFELPGIDTSRLELPATESVNFELPEIDTSALELPGLDISAVIDFAISNPLAILGGGAAIALPLIVSIILRKPESYGTVSAKDAYAKLIDKDVVSQILDIRVGDEIKTEGSPDLRRHRKRVLQVPYAGDSAAYLKKVLTKVRDAENTTIYVLDRFDGNSSTVAKLLANGGLKGAYAIKDGAEGPSGWQRSGLPWLVPSKGFPLNLENLKDLFSYSEGGSIVPATLGVAAAAGVGLVVFSEAETALQLLGSAALIQLFVKKFLFAKDRKRTLEELQTFLDTKVAPKELVEELKGIAAVLLPKFEDVRVKSVNDTRTLEKAVDGAPISETALQIEVNSPVLAESESEEPVNTEVGSPPDLPRSPRPLSPYAQYPGMKPPTSPTPSRPGPF